MDTTVLETPLLTESAARCAIFKRDYGRRPGSLFFMFYGGDLAAASPPPGTSDGWASGTARVFLLRDNDRRWLAFSWSIVPIPDDVHFEALQLLEPICRITSIPHGADTRARWDAAGCRVRLTLSRVALATLQSEAGDPLTAGAWLHRILHPRLAIASSRIVTPGHIQLFIPE